MPLADAVIEHMRLEQQAPDRFIGVVDDHGMGRVFGGQVVGQALIAASNTVGGRHCHSLHSYFLRAGNANEPVVYEVERIRDGGSFSTREVVAMQNGKAIFKVMASFQQFEEGLAHQVTMPDVPSPDEVPSDEQLLERRRIEFPNIDDQLLQMVYGAGPVEVKRVTDFNYFKPEKMPPVNPMWFRLRQKLGSDLSMHQSLLSYASDIGFLVTSAMPHGKSGMAGLKMASIDHSMWFHRPFNFEDWLLIAKESPVSASTRGFSRANIFTQDGTLVASATQEGLLRES